MQSLAEFQRLMRGAVVDGDLAAVAQSLRADGRDVSRRLDVHRRHYHTSLIAAVMNRFPATAWLLGSPLVETAAAGFVRAHPPLAPCIAEYGDRFPAWLAQQTASARVPFVEAFATLDWQLGRLAVSADGTVLTPAQVSHLTEDEFADAVLSLQAGTYYLQSDWPIDTLVRTFLSRSEGEPPNFEAQPVWLEARGSRGAVSIDRLSEAEWVFRAELHHARPVGVAAERARQVQASFDPGTALAQLFAEALVTSISSINGEPE